ncbi:DUF2087 domain-containing protein [Humibacter soli]
MTDDISWRPVVAALANNAAREVYCRLHAGMRLDDATAAIPSAKRDRVLDTLRNAGLVDVDDATGEITAAAPFADILAADRVPARVGVDRFLTDGRIDSYPMTAVERRALLLYVAERAFRPDEQLTEAQVNERLRVFTDDHVTARRYLVDFGILERTSSGTSYALSPERSATR